MNAEEIVDRLEAAFKGGDTVSIVDNPHLGWDFEIERGSVQNVTDYLHLSVTEMDAIHELPVRIHSSVALSLRLIRTAEAAQ